VDILLINGFPYWEGVSIDKSVDTMFGHLEAVQALNPNIPVWVGETGHPWHGDTFGIFPFFSFFLFVSNSIYLDCLSVLRRKELF